MPKCWEEGTIVPGTLDELKSNMIDCSRCGGTYLRYADPYNNIRLFEACGYLCYRCYLSAPMCEVCGDEQSMTDVFNLENRVDRRCRACYMGEDRQETLEGRVYKRAQGIWDAGGNEMNQKVVDAFLKELADEVAAAILPALQEKMDGYIKGSHPSKEKTTTAKKVEQKKAEIDPADEPPFTLEQMQQAVISVAKAVGKEKVIALIAKPEYGNGGKLADVRVTAYPALLDELDTLFEENREIRESAKG